MTPNGDLKGLGMNRVSKKISPINVKEPNTLDIQTAVQISISEEGHFAAIQPIVPIPYANHFNNQVEFANIPNGLQEFEICHIRLAKSTSLSRHRKIHSKDKPHKCPYCSKGFIQRSNMKVHIKTHRMESAQGNLLEGIDNKIVRNLE